ncbi:YggT family protein [Lactococcus lactis]|uniref:YggT family protein n=1 Tax=Lactococcus lactis TaxID=1358 RepID=A0AB35KA21_9LACT|nr:YggT family protein [Lactococcus lactis]MDG4978880.1 YggT family protein [Lactococcus lactis]MDG5048578.1 YggT family protein [Lactococcus lactis]MDY4363110.1 YggT family protein [Lactococcus lactis subsp. lactis]
MLITFTIINWLLRLLDVYSIILVIYALMSWIPTLYGTWFGRIIVKVSRPYLSLFENLPLQFWGLDFSIVIAFIVLKFIQRFIVIVFNGVFY